MVSSYWDNRGEVDKINGSEVIVTKCIGVLVWFDGLKALVLYKPHNYQGKG